MRDPLRQFKRAVTMPPGALAAKVRRKLRTRGVAARQRREDATRSTYRASKAPAALDPLTRLLQPIDVATLLPHRDTVAELAGRALHHEFDLLGSGWTQVVNRYGLEVTDANRPEAERIASLYPADYSPIDWHVDFKSEQQHRWDPCVWYRDQPQVVGRGIDVKLPWELARMQHLPMLALGYALAKADAGHSVVPRVEVPVLTCAKFRGEFRAQVLDFIAHNPPRFGVNWNCAMDVSIRVAGWVLTFDLFHAVGAEFDDAFVEVFARSVREHADHLAANLEWDASVRGNHYLADIAGLLIASAYLPADETTDRYLHFAARELVAETLRQFHDDGSNFEASTSYHRLSGEMVLFGSAVLQGVTATRRDALVGDRWHSYRPSTPSPALMARETDGGVETLIPPEVTDRIARMARFTQDLLDRHGRDPQIGDNDNGRFFKLLPAVIHDANGSLCEDTRNHRHLIQAADGFFSATTSETGTGFFSATTSETGTDPVSFESTVICSLLGGASFPRPDLPPFTDHIAYPGMGLYLYRHGRLTTIIRCGEVGQNGNGGHAHDDQLSFVLYADGEPVIVDPGTGCYTADPTLRDRMRHFSRHNCVAVDNGVARYAALQRDGLFRMTDRAHAALLGLSPTGLVGQHVLFGKPTRREFRCWPHELEVADQPAALAGRFAVLNLAPEVAVSRDGGALLLHIENTTLRLAVSHGAAIETDRGLYSASYGAPLAECPQLTFRLYGPDECVCSISCTEPTP